MPDQETNDVLHHGAATAAEACGCLGPAEAPDVHHSQLLEASPIPTFVLDHAHRVAQWNRAITAISGLAAEHMIGTRRQWRAFYRSPRPVLADLILDAHSVERVRDLYGDKVRASTLIDGAYEAEDYFPDLPEGGRWLYFTAAPLRDRHGSVVGAIETLQDVTDRKSAEMALQDHGERLEELVASRTAALRDANEELSQYAHVVAHDLSSPLRAIRNYANFLEKDLRRWLGDEQRRHFSGLQRALQQGDDLVRDLLEYAMVMRDPLQMQALDLGGVVRELLDLMQLETIATVHLPAEWPVVNGDRTLVYQVLRNLFSNAVKFNHSRPKQVWLTWDALPDGNCQITVRDNGIGIEARHHDHIFSGFHRLHAADEFAGSGFGLAIAKKAVTRLQGDIRVESEAGRGASFHVILKQANS